MVPAQCPSRVAALSERLPEALGFSFFRLHEFLEWQLR